MAKIAGLGFLVNERTEFQMYLVVMLPVEGIVAVVHRNLPTKSQRIKWPKSKTVSYLPTNIVEWILRTGICIIL